MIDDKSLVTLYYEHLGAGDIDAAVGLFRDGQTLWSVPGRGGLAGAFSGRAEIAAALRRWADGAYGVFTRDMHALCSAGDGDHVYAQYVLRRHLGDERTKVGVIDAWHVRDGQLAHVWTFLEDQYAFDGWTANPGQSDGETA